MIASSPTRPDALDGQLLRRYDKPGPRYTSYPSALRLRDDFELAQIEQTIITSNEDLIPRRLSLYFHIPFCSSPCFYCGCHRVITRDKSRSEPYVQNLLNEIAIVGPRFSLDREVIQLHFGGGTPNYLKPTQIGEILDSVQSHFRFSKAPDRDFSIELDPRHVAPSDIEALAFMGFNRASLGVQDFDPDVQKAVNRIQSFEQTKQIVSACRSSGFRSINIDLIYGLPHQSVESFNRTLEQTIELNPDRLAIYGYAHMPDRFKGQRQINATELPSPEKKLQLLETAIKVLGDAGYQYIGMDHFARPTDELSKALSAGTLQRNFMGYTTHAESDLLGFGVSAISRVADVFYQNEKTIEDWADKISAGQMPVAKGFRQSTDDRIREEIIQSLMCRARVDFAEISAKYEIDFAKYFEQPLLQLNSFESDHLVQIDSDAIRVTAKGRLFIRQIAMCFDAYLTQTEPRSFSSSI